ncbi:hypothetical protein A3N44_17425 [Enterobacter hormaechei subsp. steigerwaltii]|nr:hypothetical protein A3N44_17425 [Enterobacter hormaechei subsp. steigerwaltii]
MTKTNQCSEDFDNPSKFRDEWDKQTQGKKSLIHEVLTQSLLWTLTVANSHSLASAGLFCI